MVLINVTGLNVKMSAYDAVDGSSPGIANGRLWHFPEVRALARGLLLSGA